MIFMLIYIFISIYTETVDERQSEFQKAMKTVNAYIPLYFSQVKLNFSKSDEPQSSEKNLPKWRVKKDRVSKVSLR